MGVGRLYPNDSHDLHSSAMIPSSANVLSSEVSTPFWAATSGDSDRDLDDPAADDSASDIVV